MRDKYFLKSLTGRRLPKTLIRHLLCSRGQRAGYFFLQLEQRVVEPGERGMAENPYRLKKINMTPEGKKRHDFFLTEQAILIFIQNKVVVLYSRLSDMTQERTGKRNSARQENSQSGFHRRCRKRL